MTPWTVTRQAPLSIGFPRQEYWSGLPFPSSGDLLTQGLKPCLHWQADSLLLSHQGSPWIALLLEGVTSHFYLLSPRARAFLVVQMVKNLPAVQKTCVWFLDGEEPLEKAMATHFSILAWEIQWTEEPSGLQSPGLQRVRQHWVADTLSFIYVCNLNKYMYI